VGLNVDNINTTTTDKKINKIKIEVSNNNLTFYTKIVGSTTTDDSANNYLEKDSDNNLIYGLSNNSIFEIDNLTVDIEQTQSNYLIKLYIGFDNKNTLKGLEPVDNTKPTKTRAKLDFDLTVTIDTNENSVNQLFLKHKILYP
tara:strand:- start:830 stop:1258 length:429 start_codon:yes stop_codon:yes gene_type:complete